MFTVCCKKNQSQQKGKNFKYLTAAEKIITILLYADVKLFIQECILSTQKVLNAGLLVKL